MAVNKVVYGNTTLMDITDSTVDENNLLAGEVAYKRNGQRVVGTLNPVGNLALDDLTDVVITNPTIDQGITFDGTYWVNYGAKIILTYDDEFRSQTITCTQGQTVITKTTPSSGNSVTLYVPTTGNWTISAEYEGETFYSDPNPVNVIALGTAETAHISSIMIPKGATVLPTDDIQTWLACANITDKSYTTLAEVLADRETFETLIADSNACDYMARSTTWASDTTDDADAMALIGKYDYCSNALLGNATWKEAIANSDYWDSVLQPLVPTMTSDTTPSGEASASSLHGTAAWKAFDSDESSNSYWEAGSNTNQWIAYDFQSSKKLVKVMILPLGGTYSPKNAKIQAYINNDWVDLKSIVCNDSFTKQYFVLDALATAEKFRIYCIDNYGKAYVDICQLQFYGRASSNVSNTNGIIHTAMGNDSVYCVETGDTFTATDGIATVDFSQFDEGVYTFGSTTAKNPDNLSQDYTKQFKITKSPYGGTTELYLMPDAVKTLYWWGYNSSTNPIVDMKDNGWSATPTWAVSTFNTTSISIVTSSGYVKGVASQNKVRPTKAYCISVTNPSGSIWGISKQKINQSQYFTYTTHPTTLGKTEVTAGDTDEYYIGSYATGGNNITIYAFWYE